MFLETKEKLENKRWLLYLVVIFFIILLCLAGAVFAFEKKYENKTYPGIYIGDTNLGGLNEQELKEIISKKIQEIDKDGIDFSYKKNNITLNTTISSLSTDLAYQVISFDPLKTAEKAYSLGRSSNWLFNTFSKIRLLLLKKNISANIKIDETGIVNYLKDNLQEFELPARNASLNFATSSKSFSLTSEKLGKVFDYEQTINELKNNLSQFKNTPIQLETITDYPEIYMKDCLNVETKAQDILKLAPIILKADDMEWEINKEDLANLINLAKENNDVIVSLDNERLTEYLKENIASKIDQEPINARFEIQDGKVAEFQASQDGYEIDIEESIAKIKENTLDKKATSTKLIIKTTKSELDMEGTNNLGIKEIIGTGHSNFYGSTANRIHNIKTGSNYVNGLLLEPGEEFSLVENLGTIDASGGYLPELVIKDNKTMPEYGGGLCQVATTLFRTAIESGLPIVERRNHSYRVSYYEPAGYDAAVYDPKPDLRFTNDTGNNILIQYRINGNDLYFDFWGTADGRIASHTKPIIYNIVAPPETKMVETLDLEVDKIKCTEHAHNGADAYFDYSVTYTSGELIEERFSSHYVPWQEVCLIGVEELSSETDEPENNEEDKTTDKNEDQDIKNKTTTATSTSE